MTLEKAINIAGMMLCVGVIGVVGADLYHRSATGVSPSSTPLKVGDRVKGMERLGFRRSGRMLLLVTASTCHFCTNSIPFYQRLSITARRSGVPVVAVAAEPVGTNRQFLASGGVLIDATLSGEELQLPTRGTPTLVIVRNDGQILSLWEGLLDSSSESRVLEAVSDEPSR